MISLFKKANPLFRKIAGGYFAILGGLVFIGLLIVAIILFSAGGVPVSMFQHFVSNLGVGPYGLIVPNGSTIVFTVACVVEALLLYPFIFQISEQAWIKPGQNIPGQEHARLNNRLVIVAFVTALIALAGLIVLAFFSMDSNTIIPHAIGAMSFFFGTIIFGALYLLCFEIRKQSNWILRITSGLVLGFFVAFIVAVMIVILGNPALFTQFLENPMTMIAGILGNSTDTTLTWVRFYEWLYILSMLGWSIYLGTFSVKLSKAEKKDA